MKKIFVSVGLLFISLTICCMDYREVNIAKTTREERVQNKGCFKQILELNPKPIEEYVKQVKKYSY